MTLLERYGKKFKGGREQAWKEVIREFLDLLDDETIVARTRFVIEDVKALRN